MSTSIPGKMSAAFRRKVKEQETNEMIQENSRESGSEQSWAPSEIIFIHVQKRLTPS